MVTRWRARLSQHRPTKARAPRSGLRCERYREHFGEYLEGSLGPTQVRTLQEHVEICIACRSLLSRARRKRDAFNELLRGVLRGDPLAPEHLKSDLRVCLRCVTAPGSVRCPRLRSHLRLVAAPSPP